MTFSNSNYLLFSYLGLIFNLLHQHYHQQHHHHVPGLRRSTKSFYQLLEQAILQGRSPQMSFSSFIH